MLTEAEEGQMELSDLMGMQDIVWLGKCLQHQFPGDLPHCLAGIDLWELVQVVHSQDAPLASPCPARCFKKAKPDVGLPQDQGPTTPESLAASMPKGWEVKFGFDVASFTVILSRVKAALFWLRTLIRVIILTISSQLLTIADYSIFIRQCSTLVPKY